MDSWVIPSFKIGKETVVNSENGFYVGYISDLRAIQNSAIDHGYDITLKQAQDIWDDYSGQYHASWMSIGSYDPDSIWEDISGYFLERDEETVESFERNQRIQDKNIIFSVEDNKNKSYSGLSESEESATFFDEHEFLRSPEYSDYQKRLRDLITKSSSTILNTSLKKFHQEKMRLNAEKENLKSVDNIFDINKVPSAVMTELDWLFDYRCWEMSEAFKESISQNRETNWNLYVKNTKFFDEYLNIDSQDFEFIMNRIKSERIQSALKDKNLIGEAYDSKIPNLALMASVKISDSEKNAILIDSIELTGEDHIKIRFSFLDTEYAKYIKNLYILHRILLKNTTELYGFDKIFSILPRFSNNAETIQNEDLLTFDLVRKTFK